jgi:DNA-binding HxlR family transcriptional regulator
MVKHRGSEAHWLLNGRQRRAVAQVLRQPMTVSHLWQLARELAPKIQLRDVSSILRQLQKKGLVQCLNPSLVTGRVYFWTQTGRDIATTALGCTMDALPARSNWKCLGQVARASVRRNVLEEISRAAPPGRCVSEIRRQLRDKHPIELSRAIRAVRELTSLNLVRTSAHSHRKKSKLYELTPVGRRVVERLKQKRNDSRSL